jgi:hypothetical protein
LVKDGKGTTANYGIIENGASIARFKYNGLDKSVKERSAGNLDLR